MKKQPAILQIISKEENNMPDSQSKENNQYKRKKGFTLPTTSSKPTMPRVKQPKEDNNK